MCSSLPHAISQRGFQPVSRCLLDTLLLILDTLNQWIILYIMQWDEMNWTPVHPKCIFWTQFWNPRRALLSHLMYTDVGPLLTCVCHIRNTTLNFLSHLKQIAYKVNVTLNSHKKYLKPVSPQKCTFKNSVHFPPSFMKSVEELN